MYVYFKDNIRKIKISQKKNKSMKNSVEKFESTKCDNRRIKTY